MVTALARSNENELYIEDEGGEAGREPKIEESFNSPVYDSSNFVRREQKIQESFNPLVYDSSNFIRREPRIQESFNSPGYDSSNFVRREPKIQESFNSPVYDLSNFLSVPPGAVDNKIQASVPPLAYIAGPYGLSPYRYYPYRYYNSYSPYGTPPYYRPVSSAYGAMLNPAFVSALMPRFTYENYGRAPYPDYPYISNYYRFGYSPASIRRGPVGASSPVVGFVPPAPPSAPSVPAPALFTGMAPPLPPAGSAVPAPGLFAGMNPSRPPTLSAVPAPFPHFSNGISGFAGSITNGAWVPPGTNKGGQMSSIRKTF